jgi:hypothetical protein
MNFQRTLGIHLMTTLVLALGLAACDLGEKQIGDGDGGDGDGDGDGESGDGDGDGDGGDGDGDAIGPCGEEMISILPTTQDPIAAFDGKSVTDLFAFVEGDYTGTFTWGPAGEGVVLIDHLGTESPLTISATFAGGDVVLTEVPLAGQWVGESPIGLCTNTIEFDITLEFATADGVFDESLLVRVTAISHADPEGGDTNPSMYHHLDMAAHQGDLMLSDFEVVDGTLTDLLLLASFGEIGMSGSLNTEVEVMDWVGFGSIASFDASRTEP